MRIVQEFDPTGVAARDLTECLLIQIKPLGRKDSILEMMVKHHLKDLETKKYKIIASVLNVSVEQVIEAALAISQLEPSSSAAVTDGLVVLGGRDRMIHALDAATGKERWSYMTRARIDSSPAIAGGRAFVGCSDGKLYAVDLASGKVDWEHEDGAALTSSPALASGKIVIGSTEGRVLCFA